jgi:two-component system, OmpR family, sensor kinase
LSADPRLDAGYHMRFCVDRVPSMLAYWDHALVCRFANRAYETWFGADPDRLLGSTLQELLGPKLFALNEPHIRAALAGERQLFERIIPGPDGVQRHGLTEYIPDVADGTVRGFVVQVAEVTQLYKTQAALRREQELRAQIEAHAAQLQALLQERTEMVHVMAHEVRQPLHNASAALERALTVLSGSSEFHSSVMVVRAQAVLAEVQRSLDNTLTVASLLARPDPIHVDDADIDTLIRVAIGDLPSGERGRIEVVRATATRTALMDVSLMRLALRNLLSNALAYSPPGAPVQVRVADSDTPLALLIEVCDRGAGIERGVLPRLFTRGARGTGRQSGHGLGLYIVRQVMLMHRGTVEVAHTGPEGSTLRLTIVQDTAD